MLYVNRVVTPQQITGLTGSVLSKLFHLEDFITKELLVGDLYLVGGFLGAVYDETLGG